MTYRTFECDRVTSLKGSISELIHDLSERVIPLQIESKEPWQIIRFEIWEDSGRIIGFPAMRKMAERIDVAGGQVVCSELAERINDLDYEEISDDTYDERVSEIVDHIGAAVSSLASEKGNFEFRVYNQDGIRITVS